MKRGFPVVKFFPLSVMWYLGFPFFFILFLCLSFSFGAIIVIIVTLIKKKVIPNIQRSHFCRILILIVPLLHAIDFIQNVIKEEQQLEAIKYICALEVVDSFPLVPLLNDHLMNSKRKAEDLCKEGDKSLPVQVFSPPFCLCLYVLFGQTFNHLPLVHICSWLSKTCLQLMGISKELTALRAAGLKFTSLKMKTILKSLKSTLWNRKSSRQRKSMSMTPMSKMDLVLDLKLHYCSSINNNKQAVVPKLWDRRWILNKLIKFDHSTLSRYVLLLQPW